MHRVSALLFELVGRSAQHDRWKIPAAAPFPLTVLAQIEAGLWMKFFVVGLSPACQNNSIFFLKQQ
jgi:hypothetical protein